MFYIFIPQAVDQGIQHRDDQGIKDGSYFVSVEGVTGLGLHIHKYQSPIEDSDHCQVRSTGGESLLPSLS